MKKEVLLTEHRELIELYMHRWRSIFYVGVSYVICNGALGSLLGILLTLQQPTFVVKALILVPFLIAIIASITFLLWVMRTKVELVSVVNRGLAIENTFQEEEMSLDTFENCIVAPKTGKFLVDSKGTYAKIRGWQKLDNFGLLYTLWLAIVFSWIIVLSILYVSL